MQYEVILRSKSPLEDWDRESCDVWSIILTHATLCKKGVERKKSYLLVVFCLTQ